VIPLSKLTLRIFDGTRNPFAAPAQFLITITDGNHKQLVRDYFDAPIQTFDLPFYDNSGDLYSLVVWVDGYRQVGFAPVKLSDSTPTTLDLMLVANDPGFSFVDARWDTVSQKFPFLGGDTTAAAAEARYENLLDQHEPVIACFLNLVEAMGQIFLANGTPLTYIKQIRWDQPPQQDRFFAYCDAELVNQVRDAANRGLFEPELDPSLFHPSATNSWKQIQFGEANVQLTFHENDPDTKIINGVKCVTVEPDIDYYRDLGAHTLLEVFPNGLTHSLTNPVEVYILRWVAGQHAGIPQFAPLYTLTSIVPAAAMARQTSTPPAKKSTTKLKRR
jgi:hypothetical protein